MNKTRVLITGITGMIGMHVANACRKRGYETFGIARNSVESRLKAVQDPSIIRCDVLDRDNLMKVFNKVKPDIVFHFAAQAYNGYSWDCENLTHLTNITGTVNLLRCAREVVPDAKIVLACSSAEYGDITIEDCPLKEDRLLKPITPYGVSKLATEALGHQYFCNYGMKIYLPRLFIHVGTGHPPATAIQNFARQIAMMKKGKQEPVMKAGNLDSSRDFIDVRDGVEALMIILDKGKPGVPINVCNNELVSLKEVLDILIKISGQKFIIELDKELLRPSDEKVLLGDNSRLKSLGWKRKYSMEQTLIDVYNDWLSRIE